MNLTSLNVFYKTNNDDSIWIISQKKYKTFLSLQMKSHLKNKLQQLFSYCFKDDDEDNFDILKEKENIFCFYIKDVKDHLTKDKLAVIISSIVSVVIVEVNNSKRVTLWNICNDLKFKKGYMRGLMDVLKLVLIVAGIKTIQLYIEKTNPYLEKALALYREKGFKKVTSKYNDSFTLDCSL